MGLKMENSSSPLLFLHRNLITPLFSSASQKSKLLHLLHQLVVAIVFVVVHVVHALPFHLPFRLEIKQEKNKFEGYIYAQDDQKQVVISSPSNNTAIARAISQLLSLVNEVPVSSRKYEVVRCLADKLIDENLKEGSNALRKVNCVVLAEAFGRALSQLEAALLDQEYNVGIGFGLGPGVGEFGLGWVVKAVKGWYVGREGGRHGEPSEVSAEKMAAELLWLAQRLEASGAGEVAVEKWAWASNLGWLALTAEPRVQASLVKLTAFLIKQAKDMGKEQQSRGEDTEQPKQIKMKMLLTWIPLLCRASNGTDAPTLSISERGEIERALEEIIDLLEEEENQEKVLSLWLHHFTQSPSSDWPNLYGSYIRWCTVSRKLLLTR